MIAATFKEAFSSQWLSIQITDKTNELVILRQIIPWQSIIDKLMSFYHPIKGRMGVSLRVMVALIILRGLRHLSDEKLIAQTKENRYMQYFANIPDAQLNDLIHPSTLTIFRNRLGIRGMTIIEREVFFALYRAGVIDAESLLIDSTVLEPHIEYPTDIALLFKALKKMKNYLNSYQIELWWEHDQVKKLWREYNLSKNKEKSAMVYLESIKKRGLS